MKNKKIILTIVFLQLVALFAPTLQPKRRRKIIPRFEPVLLQAQNDIQTDIDQPTDGLPSLNENNVDTEENNEPLEADIEEPEEEEETLTIDDADTELDDEDDEENNEPDEPEGADDNETEPKDIYLNFEETDLKAFVDYISELKQINLILDPKIAGNKISLTIRDPLSVEGAWNIFLTILEMSNFSIVKVGNVHKIIPKPTKLTEPLPVFINTPAESLPDSDLTIRYLTFLNNIPIERVQLLLQSMLSKPNKLIPHKESNGFIITDKSYNIKAAMKVIHELDRSDVKQWVTVMRLKQANADDVKKLFEGLMRKQEINPLARLLGRVPESSAEYFAPTTKIIAEPRTNSLILLGDQKSIKKIEDFIVKHIDTELKGVKSPIHIYELKYTDVDQIKEILESITESDSESPAAKHGGIRGGLKYFKKMNFAMDKQNNRLLVSSTSDQDWKLIKKTIQDLDKPQPQVALETMIVSVKFDHNKELGAQIRNKRHGQLGRHIDAQAAHLTDVIFEPNNKDPRSLLGNLIESVITGLGSTVLTFGNIAKSNVWASIRMLQAQNNVSVSQQPFLLTTNLKKARLQAGETRRVSYQQAIADNTGNAGDARGFENVSADLVIEVKPQINLDGVIALEIDVKIEEFTTFTEDRPNTETQTLHTKVSIADGQVLVLGGFVKTKVTEVRTRTPILGSIPILGWLFKSKARQVIKEYTFIFMSPTIVKPRQIPGTNLYTKLKLKQAENDIEDAIPVRKSNDPIHNWFFNAEGETYSHKIIDYANARYQPTSVDIINDPYYRTEPLIVEQRRLAQEKAEAEKTQLDSPPDEETFDEPDETTPPPDELRTPDEEETVIETEELEVDELIQIPEEEFVEITQRVEPEVRHEPTKPSTPPTFKQRRRQRLRELFATAQPTTHATRKKQHTQMSQLFKTSDPQHPRVSP